MDIRISKESEVPIRQQLAEQIAFQIATGRLAPGQALPSVRELARRLKIHHNTVSHAYQDLVRRTWLVRRRGRRVEVRAQAGAETPAHEDLDALINRLVRVARDSGHSLQELRERVRQRLLAEPPDHLLVVDQEEGLRRLLREELQEALPWPVECCPREELAANPGLGLGALVVAPAYAYDDVLPLVPGNGYTVSIAFSAADEHVDRIRNLDQPSVIAVVSISPSFLRTALSLLAPAAGKRHSLCTHALPLEDPASLRGADLVFCDTIAMREVAHPRALHYRVIDPRSLACVAAAMQSAQPA